MFSSVLYSQLSNSHWLPPLNENNVSSLPHYVFLSTPVATPFEVTITDGAGNAINGSPFTISQGSPRRILIGGQGLTDMFISDFLVNQVNDNRGLILTGSEEFSVSFRVAHNSHAEHLVSKGTDALGTDFRVGSLPNGTISASRNFVTGFMATQDGTTVVVSDYNTDIEFEGLNGPTPMTQTFQMDAGDSVVLTGHASSSSNDPVANLDGFIGARIQSNLPIAVSSGNALGNNFMGGGSDFNLDQVLPIEQIGTEYIVVRGNGDFGDNTENPLVIATEPNTDVFINGSNTPFTTLVNAGDFITIPETFYQGTAPHQNMFIETSSPAYLYQIINGAPEDITSGLSIIPPLSCFLSRSNEIIFTDTIIPQGSNPGVDFQFYNTTLTILTTVDATLSINGGTIPPGAPLAVTGNPNWVTYRIDNITGNVTIESTGPMAAGVLGWGATSPGGVFENSGFFGYYSDVEIPTADPVDVCITDTANLFDAITSPISPGGTWSPQLAGGGDIFDASQDASGVYTYSVMESCGLVEVDVTVTVFEGTASLTTLTNNGPICLNDDAIFTLEGTPDAVVSFTLNGGATQTVVLDASGMAQVTVMGATEDQTIVVLQIEDLNEGCPVVLDETQTIEITEGNGVITSLSNNGPICSSTDAVFTLEGTPDGIVSFSINGGAIQTIVLDTAGFAQVTITAPAADQTITLTEIIDPVDGCPVTLDQTQTISVTSLIDAVVLFSYNTLFCETNENQFPDISAPGFTNGGVFAADTGLVIDGNTGEIDVSNSIPGPYTITYTVATDLDNCVTGGVGSFDIVIETALPVSFAPFEDTCLNSTATDLPLESLEGVTGTWFPAVIDSAVLGTTTYTFTPDPEFCAAEFSIDLTVINCAIQRGISPNNDGLNDFFDLRSFNVREIQIFSRLGNEVFSMENYEDQWQGQSNDGSELPTGTYYYVIVFEDMETRTGWIYVQREE